MNSNIYIPKLPHLKAAIQSVWQSGGFTRYHNEHIIPKGNIEIIFNFSKGSPMLAHIAERPYDLPKCFINGFNKLPVNLQLPEQQTFFGIQFQPLAVKKILGIPACEFSDVIVDLSLVDSNFDSLWHQLADQINFDSRISVLLSWLENALPGWHPQENMINDFLSGIDQHDVTVPDLARTLCYSPRQLSRKITEATGMNTEEILLYKKYLHAVHLIQHTDLSLTKIAFQSHFSDQSHFIKSFKTYTRMTPGEYKSSKRHISGHIYQNVR